MEFLDRILQLAPWFHGRAGIPWTKGDIPVKPPEQWLLAANRTQDVGATPDNWMWFVCCVLSISDPETPDRPVRTGPRNLKDPYVRSHEGLLKFQQWVRNCRDTVPAALQSSALVLGKSTLTRAQTVLELGIPDPCLSAEILLAEMPGDPETCRRVRNARLVLHFHPGYDPQAFPLLQGIPLEFTETEHAKPRKNGHR